MPTWTLLALVGLAWGAISTLGLWRAQVNYRRMRNDAYHDGYLAGLAAAQQGFGGLMGGNQGGDGK